MPLKHSDLSHVGMMLRTREGRVLTWSLGARLAFFTIFIVLLLLHLVGLVNPGIVAQTDVDAIASLAVLAVASIFISLGFVLAKRGQRLFAVGFGSVLLDLLMLALLPLIWYKTVELPDGSPAFLMKNELFTLGMVVMVVNSMALRPVYPAIMAAGMIVIHFVIMQWVLADPRVTVTSEFVEHFYTSAVNPGIFVVRMLILALVGGFLAFLAWFARRNIRDAVELEVSNFEIKEQQAQLIHDGKMAAMSGLVAGVAHEVNNPLGVVSSSLETSERCAAKLAEEFTASTGSKIDRILQIMKDSNNVALQAIERISKLVQSLKDFSRLDEAELQLTDLRADLDTALSLIEPDKKGKVAVVKEYGDIPQIECRPRELNQVFMTIILNAFEAMGGTGTLRLNTETVDGHVTIAISDTGPGMPDDKLSDLFEIGFAASKGRISMGLGLPMAHRIVKRHNGELLVQSKLGKGTLFMISLPLNDLPGSLSEHIM